MFATVVYHCFALCSWLKTLWSQFENLIYSFSGYPNYNQRKAKKLLMTFSAPQGKVLFLRTQLNNYGEV